MSKYFIETTMSSWLKILVMTGWCPKNFQIRYTISCILAPLSVKTVNMVKSELLEEMLTYDEAKMPYRLTKPGSK